MAAPIRSADYGTHYQGFIYVFISFIELIYVMAGIVDSAQFETSQTRNKGSKR